jgi:hypothetical protein
MQGEGCRKSGSADRTVDDFAGVCLQVTSHVHVAGIVLLRLARGAWGKARQVVLWYDWLPMQAPLELTAAAACTVSRPCFAA